METAYDQMQISVVRAIGDPEEITLSAEASLFI